MIEGVTDNTEKILSERKDKLTRILKEKKEWVYYIILGFIVLISFYIRTRNVSKLKDITTGTWTLGPDLDPFLFLRWAKYIIENGSLMQWDMMRYVPLGYNTAGEMKLLSYMIVWFHQILGFFSKEVTVTYSAILFPAVMFCLTGIAFFLFARKVFYKEEKTTRNVIALIATAFLILIPSLLPRTIAGIPEKESAAFFFMFMAFYFFIEAVTSEKIKKGIIFGMLSGIATGLMALIWGGVIFVFLTISPSILLAFIFGKVKKREFYIYSSWLLSSFILMMVFSTRYSITRLIFSTSTASAIGIGVIISISLFFIIDNSKLKKLQKKIKVPDEIFAILVSVLILIVIIIPVIGPSFLYDQASNVVSDLIVPVTDRFGMTVAENRQPYFASEWKSSFGPIVLGIPLYFWLFFIGSVSLFSSLIKNLSKKERMILIFSYFIFLISLIFSRYSSVSILDGISALSLLVYFGGWTLFLGSFTYFFYKRYQEGSLGIFKTLNFSYILYFIVLTLGIIGARGGIRLIMVLGAVSPIAISFLIVKHSKKALKEKDETKKFFFGIIAVLVIIASLFTAWQYYQEEKVTAENFAPGVYQFQWQKAMAWVRENTSEDAVFAHWWDYGYWLQSIGERATILDGGNAIGYWNHLMGRYVLTGPDEREALEFLYAHNGTHLLIDSTEIGKYTAYSSIGSDENYDRFSWIPNLLMDKNQILETKNETTYFYAGGAATDEDIIWNQDGKEIFLPRKKAGIGAVIIRVDSEGQMLQPVGIFVYNQRQYNIPLNYVYFRGELYEFESGLDAGVFIFPSLETSSDGKASINGLGAMFYLSPRTVHSQLARLYLFDQDSEYFKLAHTESNFVVEDLRQQGQDIGEFIYYQGFQGPIKIWEVSYPSDIEFNPEYISKDYPIELRTSKSGEYN